MHVETDNARGRISKDLASCGVDGSEGSYACSKVRQMSMHEPDVAQSDGSSQL